VITINIMPQTFGFFAFTAACKLHFDLCSGTYHLSLPSKRGPFSFSAPLEIFPHSEASPKFPVSTK
jgi:hypothetical protein